MPRRMLLAVAGVCLLGAGVRVALALQDSSLWYDEAALTVNLLSRSFAELSKPLDLAQSAPLGFLWAERAAGLAGGGSEAAFRSISLVGGIALLVLLAVVAWRLEGPRLALIATSLAALSPVAVRYSYEVKPYGLDALATLVVLALALAVVRDPGRTRRWIGLGAAGILALLFTTAIIFTLVGVSIALLWRFRRGEDRRAATWSLGLGGAWAASFLLLYATFVRPAERIMRGIHFWDDRMLTFGAPDLAVRWANALHEVFAEPVNSVAYSWPTLFPVLVALGLGLWMVRRLGWPALSVMAVGAYLAMFAAAVAGRFPPGARLVHFLAPFTWLLFAAAAVAVIQWLPTRLRDAAAVAAALVLIAWRWPVVRHEAPMGPRIEHSREVIARAVAQAGGSHVYVGTYIIPVWLHYSTDWRNPVIVRELRGRLQSSSGTPGDTSWRVFPFSQLGHTQRLSRWSETFGRYSNVDLSAPAAEQAAQLDRWADREIATLLDAGARSAWLVVAKWYEQEAPALVRAAQKRCGRVAATFDEKSAVAHRIEFNDVYHCGQGRT